MAIVRLEGLGQLKNPVTSGIEPASFRFCHIVPQPTMLRRALPAMYLMISDDIRKGLLKSCCFILPSPLPLFPLLSFPIPVLEVLVSVPLFSMLTLLFYPEDGSRILQNFIFPTTVTLTELNVNIIKNRKKILTQR
jgi:hypothetical protein